MIKAPMASGELTGKRQAYGGRITSFVVLSCAVAASGGFLFGYDLGVSGGVTSMEPFLRKFFPDVQAKMKESHGESRSNYCKFNSQLLTAFTSSLYVAGLVASFCASPVTRALGRKASMLLGGVAFMAGAVLGGLALDVYMLIIGRVLLGVGIGFTNQSIPLYLSEMAPSQHRGAFTNAFDFFVSFGIVSANLINYATEKLHSDLGWRISLGAAIVPATTLSVAALFLPETPNGLIQQPDSVSKAAEMLRRIRGTDDVAAELDDVIAAGNASRATRRPLLALLQRKRRPQLAMAVLIPFLKQMTGVTVITFYSPVIFRTIGLRESSSLLSTVVTGVIHAGATLLAMVVVDRVGRRKLLIAGGVQMLAAHLMIGSVLAAKLGDHGGVDRGYGYVILVSACVFVAGFGLSWGPLGWLVPSEIFPLEVRSVGQSIVVAVTMLFVAINGQSLLAMLCRLKYGVFFFFGGWILIMTVFVGLFLPETKNVPIEKMDEVWRRHWFWNKFVTDEGGEEQSVVATSLHSC